MKFTHNVTGPNFEESTLVFIQLNNVELSFRLPDHWGTYDSFLFGQDLTDIEMVPSSDWRVHPLGQKFLRLVKQSWFYDDIESLNHVVLTNFEIELMVLTPEEQEKQVHLSKKEFDKWLFHLYRLNAVEGVESDLGTEVEIRNTEEWQAPKQISDIDRLDKGAVEWLTMTLGNKSVHECPDWMTYIPLNKESLLVVNCDIKIFSSDHESINIPEVELDQLRKDIRDEILSHISINYTPAILEYINEINS